MTWELVRTVWLIIGGVVVAGGVVMVIDHLLGVFDEDGLP